MPVPWISSDVRRPTNNPRNENPPTDKQEQQETETASYPNNFIVHNLPLIRTVPELDKCACFGRRQSVILSTRYETDRGVRRTMPFSTWTPVVALTWSVRRPHRALDDARDHPPVPKAHQELRLDRYAASASVTAVRLGGRRRREERERHDSVSGRRFDGNSSLASTSSGVSKITITPPASCAALPPDRPGDAAERPDRRRPRRGDSS